MAQHNITGLGLGLPHSGLSYPSEDVSRRPHERSQSLHDPSYYRPRSAHDASGHTSRPHSTYSGKQSLHSVESVRAMAELDAAAASVVGMVPSIEGVGLMDQSDNSRSHSDTVSVDRDLSGVSVAHLKSARIRARSAPTDIQEDSLDSRTHSGFPRADSLLRLDSNSTSKDLKKLLTTRVRHAPSTIDTNKANASGASSSSSSPIKNDPRASQLEPEKSRPRVEIYLVLNNHVAIEGGCLGGTLIVRTRKPRRGEARHVRIDGGKIRIIGFEGVSETERYAFYQCSAPLSETSEDCSRLYEPDSSCDSDGYRIAQEGTYSVPFTVHVPHSDTSRPRKNMPKGVIRESGVSAAIKYIILISFKVKDDADNSIGIDKHADLGSVSIAHFYRSVELWPTYGLMALHRTEETHPALGETGTVSARTARGLFFGGAGMLHLTAVLHRKVWLAGQQCTVYIGAWNETNKSIKTVTLTIIRNVSIGRPNQSVSSNKKQIAETTLDAVRGPNFGPVTGKGWWGGIEAGGACEFSHSIEIPADALTVNRTHIIEVSYVLRVTLVTGSLSSNVSVDLPFRIINAISTDGLPAPPPPGLLIGGLKLPKEVPVSFTFDASPKQNSTTLDPRTWNFPSGGWSKTSGLQEQHVLEWMNHASNDLRVADDVGSGLSGFKEDTGFLDRASQVSQISQDTRTSYQLFDGISPGDSVSRLMSQVEDGFNTQEQLPSHQSSQSNSVAGSSILKPAPSAKHRVTFLTPKTANARAMQESSAMSRETEHSSPGAQGISAHLKEPSSRRFILEDSRSTRARPDQAMSQLMDTWNNEDADEVLRSLRMDEGGFDSFRSSQGQELVLNSRVSGPITGSSASSDPWSARSGSSYSQPRY
ncbi:hypothetical protein FRC12_001765 [Ceratobasidium sp. 428]|nr:hypothetical protein FRC12_001765 [Ceratobasidium sp. 428]